MTDHRVGDGTAGAVVGVIGIRNGVLIARTAVGRAAHTGAFEELGGVVFIDQPTGKRV